MGKRKTNECANGGANAQQKRQRTAEKSRKGTRASSISKKTNNSAQTPASSCSPTSINGRARRRRQASSTERARAVQSRPLTVDSGVGLPEAIPALPAAGIPPAISSTPPPPAAALNTQPSQPGSQLQLQSTGEVRIDLDLDLPTSTNATSTEVRSMANCTAISAGVGTTSPRPHRGADNSHITGANPLLTSFPTIVPHVDLESGNQGHVSRGIQYRSRPIGSQYDNNSRPSYTGIGNSSVPHTEHRSGFAVNDSPPQSPLRPVGDRLGSAIPNNIREKIWKGEYVDFNVLVNAQEVTAHTQWEARDEQRTNLAMTQEDGRLVLKPVSATSKNKIATIELWTNAFLVYASIVLEANLNCAQDLLKYCHLIRSAASRYYGYGWRDYDIEFRHRYHKKGGSWAGIDGELWLLHVVGGGPPRGVRGQDRPLGRSAPWSNRREWKRTYNPSTSQTQGKGRLVPPRSPNFRSGICHEFNFRSGACSRKDCRYAHKCSLCGASGHGKVFCPNYQSNSKAPKPKAQ